MAIVDSAELTPRESVMMDYEREMTEKAQNHAVVMRKLDIEAEKVTARFQSWFKIPLTIIKLPVLLLFGIAYIICAIRKHEPSQNFWDLVK